MKSRFSGLEQLYTQAVALHHEGDPTAALPLYLQVAQTLPDADVVHYNLGLAYFELGQFEEAAGAFTIALQTNPDDADSWYNLGLAWKQAGDNRQAEQAYLEALARRPGDGDILHNLGCVYMADGEIAKAVTVYELLLDHHPAYLPGVSNLAYLYHIQGELERAKELHRQLLAHNPDDDRARHMLAILEGDAIAAQPAGYVRELYDRFSHHFEQRLLGDLDYQVPELLGQLLADRMERTRPFDRVLDLGCGTGLAGERLRPFAVSLEGVDLSPGMLALAKEKQLYDRLVEDEAIHFLQVHADRRWDLIVATDMLIYSGDLSLLFSALAAKLSKNGFFCGTIELAEAADAWALLPNGRYGHSRGYIRALAEANGLSIISLQTINIRKEAGEWIPGLLWFMEKVGGET